jgi:hypothetical protein
MPLMNGYESGAGFINFESGAGFVNIESGASPYLNVRPIESGAPTAASCAPLLAMEAPEDLEGASWDLWEECADTWTDADGQPSAAFVEAIGDDGSGLAVSGEVRNWFDTLGNVTANILGKVLPGEDATTNQAPTPAPPGPPPYMAKKTPWMLIGGVGLGALALLAFTTRKK